MTAAAGIPEEMQAPEQQLADSASPEGSTADEREVALQVARMRTENARLRGELRRSQAQTQRAVRDVERVKKSTSYIVGAMLVAAAKDPRRLVLLPRDLWRLWRLRKARRRHGLTTPATPTRASRQELLDFEAARLLLPRVSSRTDRPFAIAGALTASTSGAWAPYAAVTRLLPHNAADLVRDVDPDIVVIESAAGATGEDWAHLGNPAAVDREAAALALIDAARERGRPVVLLRNSPPSHTVFLRDIAARCDLVVDGPGSRTSEHVWHVGTDIAAWNVRGAGPVAHGAAALLGTGPSLAPANARPADRTLAEALAQALSTSGIPLAAPPAGHPGGDEVQRILASARVGIAQPLSAPRGIVGADPRTLGLLAAGIPVVSGPDADLVDLLGTTAGMACIAARPADAAEALSEALARAEEGAPPDLVRTLMLRDSVPVRLGFLAGQLGLPVRPEAVWDVTAVFDQLDVDGILAQRWRPREVLAASATDRERDALGEARISVITIPELEGMSDDDIAQAASSPLAAIAVSAEDPDGILDLLCATVAGSATASSGTARMRARS